MRKKNIVNEGCVKTEPSLIHEYIDGLNLDVEVIGLESGSLSHYLLEELLVYNLPVKCIDARHAAAVLGLKVNKTDKNDARGLAEIMRCELYNEVPLKTIDDRENLVLLNARKKVVEQRTQMMNTIRGLLKSYGIRLGSIPKTETGRQKILEKISDLNEKAQSPIQRLVKILAVLDEETNAFDKEVKEAASEKPEGPLLMTIPGVGPTTALQFLSEIGNVSRFKTNKSIGAYLGLTPTQYSSGETEKQGRISKCGSKRLRVALGEAAIVILTRTKKWSKLKAWGLKLQKKKGLKKATVAVARKLACIMLSMLKSGEEFRYTDVAESEEKAA